MIHSFLTVRIIIYNNNEPSGQLQNYYTLMTNFSIHLQKQQYEVR